MDKENCSIVIISHDDNEILAEMLGEDCAPDLTSQTEVIVVIEKGKKESEAFMERMKPSHPTLHVTFVPESSRQMDSRQIAITLGVKASQGDSICIKDTLLREFSPFHIFANKVNHLKLRNKNDKGVEFDNDTNSIFLNKHLFLERECFEENLRFICNCFRKPALFCRGMWLIRIKYILAKCHLYHI
jgi:hypothetical protein